MIDFVKKDSNQEYIIATEAGILFQMQKEVPNKLLIPAPNLKIMTALTNTTKLRVTARHGNLFFLELSQFREPLNYMILCNNRWILLPFQIQMPISEGAVRIKPTA